MHSPSEIKSRSEKLIQRLLAVGVVAEKEFKGCTEQDIAELEEQHGVKLPESYKIFLRRMGRGSGQFLKSDHWFVFYDNLTCGLGGKYQDEDVLGFKLPENYFVFASRLGDFHIFFVADGRNNDPPIFGWDDNGYRGQIYQSYWDYIEDMVEYYEEYSR